MHDQHEDQTPDRIPIANKDGFTNLLTGKSREEWKNVVDCWQRACWRVHELMPTWASKQHEILLSCEWKAQFK